MSELLDLAAAFLTQHADLATVIDQSADAVTYGTLLPPVSFVALAGGDVMVRTGGSADARRPVLILHEAGSSSRDAFALMSGQQERAWIAPDLPGCGESGSFDESVTPAAQAAIVAQLLGKLGVERCDVLALGGSSSIAVELGFDSKLDIAVIYADAPDPDGPERSELVPEYGGLHLLRAWNEVRDRALLGGAETDYVALDTQVVHRRVIDRLKARKSLAPMVRAQASFAFATRVADLPQECVVRPTGDFDAVKTAACQSAA